MITIGGTAALRTRRRRRTLSESPRARKSGGPASDGAGGGGDGPAPSPLCERRGGARTADWGRSGVESIDPMIRHWLYIATEVLVREGIAKIVQSWQSA